MCESGAVRQVEEFSSVEADLHVSRDVISALVKCTFGDFFVVRAVECDADIDDIFPGLGKLVQVITKRAVVLEAEVVENMAWSDVFDCQIRRTSIDD